MRKIVSILLTVSMVMSLLVFNISAATPSEPDYITFEQYLEKYGEENVMEGLEKAEAEVMGYDQAELAYCRTAGAQSEEEGKSLFECLSEGEFLGFKVLGVSDVVPGDTHMLIHLDPEGKRFGPDPMMEISDAVSPASATTPLTIETSHYKALYSNYVPDQDILSRAYEENSGAYFYKYSYSWQGYNTCETTVTFNNTTLHCGTEDNNMYIYLNAHSSNAFIEFGLMANPGASNRNQGLYALYQYRGSDKSSAWVVEAFPKVKATSFNLTNKTMTLENKTVTIKLSIGQNYAQMYMESNGSMLFFKEENVPGLVANTSAPLTFIQAMSCVGLHSTDTVPIPTNLHSGSYFKNVKFSNTLLHNLTNPTPFKTVGSTTYFTLLAEPQYISYIYDDTANTQTVSIQYT